MENKKIFSDFKTNIVLKVEWGDLDLFAHVNNVAFFKYTQCARINYCDLIGLSSTNENNKPGFIVAAASCIFKLPLTYPDSLTVYTRIDWVKNSSFQFSHLLVNSNEKIVAESTDVIVVFDYVKKTKMLIPLQVKAKIVQQENKLF